MKFYIGSILEGKAEDYYDSLIENLASNFHLDGLVKKERISHITLKAPFELHSSKNIESCLEEFSQKCPRLGFTVQGVGHFDNEVIYLEILPALLTKRTYGSFLNKLKTVKGMSFSEYDHPNKILHATLIKGSEMQDKFDAIWKYLSNTKGKPFFSELTNFTLFGKESGKTYIHRRYDLRT